MATLNENILTKLNIEIKEYSFSKAIYEGFIESNKDEIVVINIGTDRSTGDSYAPFIGSLIEDNPLSNIKVYGTLDKPIHAKNLNCSIEKIYQGHPNAFFLSIDAALGNEKSVGNIYLRNKPLIPGAALEKDLISVGDYSIIGIINTASNFDNFLKMQNTRLSKVRKLALRTLDELIALDEMINKSVNKIVSHKICS